MKVFLLHEGEEGEREFICHGTNHLSLLEVNSLLTVSRGMVVHMDQPDMKAIKP